MQRGRNSDGRKGEGRVDGKEVARAGFRSVRVVPLCIALLFGCFTGFLYFTKSQAAFAGTTLTDFEAAQDSVENFSRFSHSSAKHSSLDCASCHKRNDNSPQPSLPGHPSCTGCHLAQFTTAAGPMCAICHSDLNSEHPPLKSFPQKFKESFNLKFDHAQHNRGSARPDKGCVSCHNTPLRRGVALSMPAGLSAHSQCYVCHTPSAESGGRDIGSCSTCHAQSGYKRASTNARAFGAAFSHAQHGPRQRLGCADCHNLMPGVALTRQVTSPKATEHFGSGRAQSCTTCHNGRRSFGDANFNDCRRCHKGSTFRMQT